MTTDPISRLEAYGDQPDVYYAPTPEECLAAAKEIRRLRKRADDLQARYVRFVKKADNMADAFDRLLR